MCIRDRLSDVSQADRYAVWAEGSAGAGSDLRRRCQGAASDVIAWATWARVVAGMSGNRLRTGSASNVMSVVFITTAALAWRAKPGLSGRAITDMAFSAVSGTCFGRSVRPLRANRCAAISVKPRFLSLIHISEPTRPY